MMGGKTILLGCISLAFSFELTQALGLLGHLLFHSHFANFGFWVEIGVDGLGDADASLEDNIIVPESTVVVIC